jgi:ergothioneine biosynthesis protein EgtB
MRARFAQELPPAARAVVELGLNHEQQHQELMLTDVKHLFARNPAKPVYHGRWPLASVQPQPLAWHAYDAGLATFGHVGDGFAFETNRRASRVRASVRARVAAATHGEFAEFIADGGYRRPELWLSLGWDTVVARGWQAPLYWERDGDAWRTFTLHGMVDIDAHTPVCHLSFFEADAYARWAGAQLPTEFEWELAARKVVAGNFLDPARCIRYRSPVRRRSSAPRNCSATFKTDAQRVRALPRIPARPGAVGEYNGKFMCGQYVLRGGSCATPASHIRPTLSQFSRRMRAGNSPVWLARDRR